MGTKRHWLTVIGIVSNLPSIWRGIIWVFDWEVRVETAVQQFGEMGGVRGMIEFFVNPPPWLALVTLPIGMFLIWLDFRRWRPLIVSDQPITKDALQIVVGNGGDFETRQGRGLYMTEHTFSVCVENTHPTKFLSNCKLFLNISNQKDQGRKDYLLEGPFTLNPTEKKLRSIASFLEPATVSQHAGKFIQLHIPIGHAYDLGHIWPWRLPIGAYTFSLWAISLETGRTETACKIWVDDNHKLHFERA